DIGLAHLRIVDRQRLEDDLALRAGDAHDGLGELEERELLRVADVHGQMLAALGEQDETANEIVDVTEAARLRSVAEDGERLVRRRPRSWTRAGSARASTSPARVRCASRTNRP